MRNIWYSNSGGYTAFVLFPDNVSELVILLPSPPGSYKNITVAQLSCLWPSSHDHHRGWQFGRHTQDPGSWKCLLLTSEKSGTTMQLRKRTETLTQNQHSMNRSTTEDRKMPWTGRATTSEQDTHMKRRTSPPASKWY